MGCSVPPALTDDQISALLDGAATPAEQIHVQQCPYCNSRVTHGHAVEQQLTTKLKRWDCPSAQRLGDYHLGLVSEADERGIVRHLEECALCKAEVEELRQFLSPVPLEEKQPQLMPTFQRRRQTFGEVIARLLPQTNTLAMRGSSRGPVVAEADGTTMIVDVEQAADEQILIMGQVAADDQEHWTGALVEVRQGGLLKATARIDDLGGWQCGPLPVAATELRITPQEGNAIVLPDLALAS